MLRDVWVLLLFAGGAILGGALGLVYHQHSSAALVKTVADRDAEIMQLNQSQASERTTFQQQLAGAVAEQKHLAHELDSAKLQLAELGPIIERQRALIAQLQAKRPQPNGAAADSPELAPPSEKSDGVVNGGEFIYRKVGWSKHDQELEVSGELENRSNKDFAVAIFHIELFDDQNRPIEKLAVTFTNFAAGKTLPIKEYTLADQPDLQQAAKRFRVTAAHLTEAPN